MGNRKLEIGNWDGGLRATIFFGYNGWIFVVILLSNEGCTQIPLPAIADPGVFYLSAFANKFASLPNKKPRRYRARVFVPKTGFEPAHPFGRYHLKVVRLPISPPGQEKKSFVIFKRPSFADASEDKAANIHGLFFQNNSECGSFSGF
jgi:hypothetical protein